MIGLDTNVLVRYLSQDDPEQARITTEYIENNCNKNQPAFINHIVLCETIWVLQRAYKVNKTLIVPITTGAQCFLKKRFIFDRSEGGLARIGSPC